jgi:hypothetical protein
MRIKRFGMRLLGFCAAALLVPTMALADNTTSGGAYSIMPGGTSSEAFLNGTSTVRWYFFWAIAGRSYCSETQGGVSFDTSSTAGNIDTILTVYRADATTSLGSNDDTITDPGGEYLSRVCWMPTVTEENYVKVERFDSGSSFNVRLRVTETTLFSNWFFVGGDYNAYTLLRNSTNTAVFYQINWRNSAGIILQSVTGTLPANGSTFVNGRSYAPVLAAVSGTVEVVHNGSAQAVVASTTVLSATTGLSFDAPFIQRESW